MSQESRFTYIMLWLYFSSRQLRAIRDYIPSVHAMVNNKSSWCWFPYFDHLYRFCLGVWSPQTCFITCDNLRYSDPGDVCTHFKNPGERAVRKGFLVCRLFIVHLWYGAFNTNLCFQQLYFQRQSNVCASKQFHNWVEKSLNYNEGGCWVFYWTKVAVCSWETCLLVSHQTSFSYYRMPWRQHRFIISGMQLGILKPG